VGCYDDGVDNMDVMKNWAAGPNPCLRDLAALENKLHLAKQAQLNKFYLIKIKENKRN